MSGEVFYGRTVRQSEGSQTAKGIVGRRADGSFYFFLEPPPACAILILTWCCSSDLWQTERTKLADDIVVVCSECLNAAFGPFCDGDIVVHDSIRICARNSSCISPDGLGTGERVNEVMLHS